jgi:hypothetical protein
MLCRMKYKFFVAVALFATPARRAVNSGLFRPGYGGAIARACARGRAGPGPTHEWIAQL